MSWFQKFRERRRLAQKLCEAQQRLEQAQARSADLAGKRQEIERIRDEAVDRIAKYRAAMQRMKDFDARLGAALEADDHEGALNLMRETLEAHAEVERLNLEEAVYNARLAKLLMESKELE